MFELLPWWVRGLTIIALLSASLLMTRDAYSEGVIHEIAIQKSLVFWWALTIGAYAGEMIKNDSPWNTNVILTIVGSLSTIALVWSFIK